MRLHREALFLLDDSARLVSLNLPGRGIAPRFFLGRTTDGNVWSVRHDLEPGLATAILELLQSEPAGQEDGRNPNAAAPYLELLARHDAIQRVESGPAYRFPSDLPNDTHTIRVTPDNASLLSRYLPDWMPDVSVGVPMTALLEDGDAVSVCCSVRLTPRAHEAGVETHRDFRGRGYAQRVVAAWAMAVREIGIAPLYSTSWENEASRAVASRLGLVQYGATLHIT
jgi:RimJ/RimL family protein N-acetyltransferase